MRTQAGCPLEARDNKRNTALLRACQHGASSVAAALLSAKVSATAQPWREVAGGESGDSRCGLVVVLRTVRGPSSGLSK